MLGSLLLHVGRTYVGKIIQSLPRWRYVSWLPDRLLSLCRSPLLIASETGFGVLYIRHIVEADDWVVLWRSTSPIPSSISSIGLVKD